MCIEELWDCAIETSYWVKLGFDYDIWSVLDVWYGFTV